MWCGGGRAASFRKKVKWIVAVAAVVVDLRPRSFERTVVRVCGECLTPELRRLLLVEQCWGLQQEGRLVDWGVGCVRGVVLVVRFAVAAELVKLLLFGFPS